MGGKRKMVRKIGRVGGRDEVREGGMEVGRKELLENEGGKGGKRGKREG